MAKTAAPKAQDEIDIDTLQKHLDSVEFEPGSVEDRFYMALTSLPTSELAAALCKLLIRGHHILDLEELANS